VTSLVESESMSPEWVDQVEQQLKRHADRLDGHDAELAAFRSMMAQVLAKVTAMEAMYAEQLKLTSTMAAQIGRLSNETTKDRLTLGSIESKLDALLPDIRRLLVRLGEEA
jgi:hypothetical protein